MGEDILGDFGSVVRDGEKDTSLFVENQIFKNS
jgi:hypothetical protein